MDFGRLVSNLQEEQNRLESQVLPYCDPQRIAQEIMDSLEKTGPQTQSWTTGAGYQNEIGSLFTSYELWHISKREARGPLGNCNDKHRLSQIVLDFVKKYIADDMIKLFLDAYNDSELSTMFIYAVISRADVEKLQRMSPAERERIERERVERASAEIERAKAEKERLAREKAEREKREEEERRRRKYEQDKRDYERALADLAAAKPKLDTTQTSADFQNIIDIFFGIEKLLRPLSDSFDIRAPIEECETCRKQCEEKREQCKKDETLTRFNAAKAKIPNGQTVGEYASLADEFAGIEQAFRSLPDSFGLQAQIEECEACRRQCEEKGKLCEKDVALSRFNTAKAKIPTGQTADEYASLADEFAGIEQAFRSLPDSFGLQAQIEECEAYRRQCEEKRAIKLEEERRLEEKRQRRIQRASTRQTVKENATKAMWTLLYFAIAAGLIFIVVYFRDALSFELWKKDDARTVLGIVFTIVGIIGGLIFLISTYRGCLSYLFGIPVAGGLGFALGNLLIPLFAWLFWLVLAAGILIGSILLFRGVVWDLIEYDLGERTITLAVIIAVIGIPVGYFVYNNQENTLTIPDDVTVIEKGKYARKRLVSVDIPNSVTSIGDNAFRQNELKAINIPDRVTSIGVNAFDNNPLTSIRIGANVELGTNAFGFGFEQFYSSNDKAAGAYKRDGSSWELWSGNFQFRNQSGNITIIGYDGIGSGWVTVPSELMGNPVIAIEKDAFRGKNLSNVIIPDSVKSIGVNAFDNNPITSISIGANVELGDSGDFGVLGKGTGFNGAYARNGSRAGTYTRPDSGSTTWTRK